MYVIREVLWPFVSGCGLHVMLIFPPERVAESFIPRVAIAVVRVRRRSCPRPWR